MAHEPSSASLLHHRHDGARARLAYLDVPPGAERDDDRTGVFDGGQARGRVRDVALHDLQPIVLMGDTTSIAGQRGDVVPVSGRLLDQQGVVEESHLDWTIVRASAFADRSPEVIRRGFGGSESGGRLKIGRAVVAAFLLGQVEDKTYLRRAVSVSSLTARIAGRRSLPSTRPSQDRGAENAGCR